MRTSYNRRLVASTVRQRSLGRCNTIHDRKDVLFSKYVTHTNGDDLSVEEVHAWVLTAPLPIWGRALFFLGEDKLCPTCAFKRWELALDLKNPETARTCALRYLNRRP